jgi:CYTH domain-containing protein
MIEIERKFLLKAMPDILPTEVVKIDQFYFKNKDGVWERVRQWNSNLYGKRWIHTIKTKISDFSNEEVEKDITKLEYEEFKKGCRENKSNSRYIKKERWIYPDGDLYWEVDIFKDKCHIVIAEIEIPSEDYDLNIPEFISKKTLLEVTGQKLFSNRSLSVKLK